MAGASRRLFKVATVEDPVPGARSREHRLYLVAATTTAAAVEMVRQRRGGETVVGVEPSDRDPAVALLGRWQVPNSTAEAMVRNTSEALRALTGAR